MGVIEIIATLLGLACVYLTIRQNIWCWPVGLAMVALYVVIFHQARLYSDMGLQVVYIVMQIYGWYYWLHGRTGGEPTPVTTLTASARLGWLGVAAIGTIGLGYSMSTWTNADLPYWDATTTVLSLVAQYLMARKKLESWLFWIAVDVLSIGIYAVKGLYPTMLLYSVFLLMAIAGWFAWRKTHSPTQSTAAAA
jgi:nicotinamide mononucleotide transporter